MSKINLLPWREELKAQKKRDFSILSVLMGAITIGCMLAINMYIGTQIERQQGRNKLLEDEMVILDHKLGQLKLLQEQREMLEKRIALIQSLQHSRNRPTKLLSTLPTLIPTGVYLTELTYDEADIVVSGQSESNPRLANMMRNIDASTWLGNGAISSIIATDASQAAPISLSQFDVAFQVLAALDELNLEKEEQP